MVSQQREQARDGHAEADLAIDVSAQQVFRAPRVVCRRPSSAASFVGWAAATEHAAQSPIRICTGAVTAATVNGIASAVRS
jgi:hypothetical protein